MLAHSKDFFRDLWRLIRPYWRSEERWASGGLLLVIIALNLGSVYLSVQFNQWYNVFYTALQDKNVDGFYHQLWIFGGLASVYIIAAIVRYSLTQFLQIRWRRWLTNDGISRWMTAKAYYRLQMKDGSTDNPDQRLADDTHGFVQTTLSLGLNFMNSVVTLFSFAAILWGLSGSLEVAGVSLPGYMLWVALVYAILGTGLTHWIGKPLIGLNYQQQKFEADFRFSLIRVRENAEGIALYNGEAEERGSLKQRFDSLYNNFWSLVRRQRQLLMFTTGYDQVAVIFPYVVAGSRYFSGALTLGMLMQTANAFGQVQHALSWFLNVYTSLADWTATVERLTGFYAALDEAHAAQSEGATLIVHDGSQPLVFNAVTVALPDGRVLLDDLSLTLAPGSRTAITGPSGCGKSMLLRVIGGLWPHWRGTVTAPERTASLYLPQKPYLPIASLRTALAYPDPADRYDDDRVRAVLGEAGLSPLAEDLDTVHHWAQRLSPGEQQRLAFARALLLRPRWLFMDEATSALEESAELALYRHLFTALPTTAIVSIAHRPAVVALHDSHPSLAWKNP